MFSFSHKKWGGGYKFRLFLESIWLLFKIDIKKTIYLKYDTHVQI